jgi:hypothetical protein
MRYSWLVLIVFLALSLQPTVGQAQEAQASGQPSKIQAALPPASELPPDAAVITIEGLCDSGFTTSTSPVSTPTSPGKALDPGCKTVITRAQYENLLGVLGARPSAYHGLKFARRYADVLLFSEKGRELGVEKDPKFQEKLRYGYLEALNQFTLARLQQQADDVSDAEAAKYYTEHPERFVQIHLLQIAVPKHKVHGAAPRSSATPSVDAAEQASMHKLALTIQKEAAAGADPDKLEEKAYKIAGDVSVPETDMGDQVPDLMPTEYRKLVFDLNAGQVSQVTENDHEFLIFKCTERHMIPATDAKRFLGWLRMRDSKQALKDSVKTQFNEQYFPPVPPGGRKEADGEKTP